jgi:hypothetical protein
MVAASAWRGGPPCRRHRDEPELLLAVRADLAVEPNVFGLAQLALDILAHRRFMRQMRRVGYIDVMRVPSRTRTRL